jgi:hypothetical protein
MHLLARREPRDLREQPRRAPRPPPRDPGREAARRRRRRARRAAWASRAIVPDAASAPRRRGPHRMPGDSTGRSWGPRSGFRAPSRRRPAWSRFGHHDRVGRGADDPARRRWDRPTGRRTRPPGFPRADGRARRAPGRTVARDRRPPSWPPPCSHATRRGFPGRGSRPSPPPASGYDPGTGGRGHSFEHVGASPAGSLPSTGDRPGSPPPAVRRSRRRERSGASLPKSTRHPRR